MGWHTQNAVLKVGFSFKSARIVELRNKEELLHFPLRLFGDSPEINGITQDAALWLWCITSKTIDETLIGSIKADQVNPDASDRSSFSTLVATDQSPNFGDEQVLDAYPTSTVQTDPTTIVLETHAHDYAAEIDFDNPEYQWHFVQCLPGTEQKLCRQLLYHVKSLNLEQEIPNIVFPVQEQLLQRGKKRFLRSKPIFSDGYILAQIKPDTDLSRLLRDTGARFLAESITPEQARQVVMWKQEQAGSTMRNIEPGCHVLVTEGLLENYTGIVKSIDYESGQVTLYIARFRSDTLASRDSLVRIEAT
ncbi:MAG: hypothetical protein HC853_03695 [Anaerolineae bacterium]|nr:hypothetical protein [Anaerolineae bacterium]